MLITYVFAGALHLAVIIFLQNDRTGAILTKGLPILLLIYSLYAKIGLKTHLKKFVFFGLLFSLCGDYLLIFPELFVFGLASFLIAHIFYIIGFSKNAKLSFEKAIPFYIIGGFLYYLFWPNLGTLKIPVFLYVITISAMLWRSASRTANKNSYYAGLIGACIFFTSDSLIGLGKFYTQIPADRLLIMLTYYTGQFLIFQSAKEE